MSAPIQIQAELLSQAYPINFGGHYVVQFLVQQRAGLPILVDWPMGEGASASIAAHNAAAEMRRGTPVTIEGDHLEVARHRGQACLRLAGPVGVRRPVPQHFTEGAAQAA